MGLKAFLARVSTHFTKTKTSTESEKNTTAVVAGPKHELSLASSEESSLLFAPVSPPSATLFDDYKAELLADVNVHVRFIFDQTGDMTMYSVESLKADKPKVVTYDSLASTVSTLFDFDTPSREKDVPKDEFALTSTASSYGRTLTTPLSRPKGLSFAPFPFPESVPVTAPVSTSSSVLVRLTSPVLDKPLPPLPAAEPVLHASQFTPLRLLGRGGQGTVALVEDRMSGSLFALKIVRKAAGRERAYPRLFDEQRIMCYLADGEDARWFLPLCASWDDEGCFYFLTKYCPQGDLWSKMRKQRGLCSADARRYSAELIHALGLLHARRILHRDIKPENILLDDDHVTLADFGISRAFGVPAGETPWLTAGVEAVRKDGDAIEKEQNEDHDKTERKGEDGDEDVTRKFCGTPGFMAPETNEGAYSYEADIYAAGVVLYIMLLGRLPFGLNPRKQTLEEQFRRIGELPVDFDVGGDVSADGQDLLERMLEKDPSRRATIPEIKAHPYFASSDWDAFARRNTGPARAEADNCAERHPRTEHEHASGAEGTIFPWFQYVSPELADARRDAPSANSAKIIQGTTNPKLEELMRCAEDGDAEEEGSANTAERMSVTVHTEDERASASPRRMTSRTNVMQRVKRWWRRRGVVSVKPRVVEGRMDMLE